MNKLVIASHNPGKLKEFLPLLTPLGYELTSSAALGLPEPSETARDFAGNARIKAVTAAKASGLPALADDSGLSVSALNGQPGVFSARYAADDYPAAFAKIIAAAKAKENWVAWFTCALCLAQPDGSTATYIGEVLGRIASEPRGEAGFGYDPIFIPNGYDRTFAEMGEAKEAISHRARAFEQVRAVLLAEAK
ncbi:RdgB/HAM1 family non-canonical purine NTP pyrophosphatase [Acidocella aminolytica]|jgi:XTP/dITP diphosphohydrolase|uniref:dITP/XTP pyrophosphatase n=1 Tax=Acidocella aminolytica 101 = DSM 11237 TaxID=1120923 RepID=A0A0D6PJL0_9PROT|nr:RdgB/HAM1 family non-canonical purine NTP pyrophosphatase [Acidocella aminolytica]GAN80984.1 deoxyribonucleotide triphosphate pyrophosphatase [Acidocella aminolytica 101 = DSM 11237]GBQ37099.1 deoxyribonucleotide triphosphate pyrophosphatase [Acidocella aminolytica 101 = DSM 11237]SHF30853.1 XTP/dITP diphosphohydrolase [Acidocella aminolytica 101 = DSM 11237]